MKSPRRSHRECVRIFSQEKIRRHALPADGAFTLIELILVMALIFVAVSMVTPQLASFFRGRAVDSEARQLLSLTRAGQSRAASEGIPMRLWVDAKAGTYGLEAEPGFVNDDPKAEQFTLDENLQIEVIDAPETTAGPAPSSAAALKNPADAHGSLPAIRFLPSGALDEGSPQAFRLTERSTGRTLSVALSRNRLQYEIQ